jgi:hypothetical protein
MSDVCEEETRKRAAQLAEGLLRSAKDDGLDPARLAALGERVAAANVASASKLPVTAMIVVSGLAVLGGLAYYPTSSENRDPEQVQGLVAAVASATPSPGEGTAPALTPASAETAAVPATVAVGLLPDAPPTVASAPRPRPVPAPSASGLADDLPGEIAALERAHKAVASHRIADAKLALADYERSFPKKLLGQEARVLEIELLLAEGQREEAEARARSFLAGAGADSPYAARVRTLVARPDTP